jgi:hypothetical protein
VHSESSIVPRGDLAGRQEGHSLGHSAGDDEARPCNVTRRFRLIFPSSEVANPIDGAFTRCFCSFSLRLLSFLLCFIPPPAATASTLARFVSSTPRFFTFRCPSLSASSSSLGALGAQLCQILHEKSIFLVAYQLHPIPGSMMALTAHASCPARPSLFSSCPSPPTLSSHYQIADAEPLPDLFADVLSRLDHDHDLPSESNIKMLLISAALHSTISTVLPSLL